VLHGVPAAHTRLKVLQGDGQQDAEGKSQDHDLWNSNWFNVLSNQTSVFFNRTAETSSPVLSALLNSAFCWAMENLSEFTWCWRSDNSGASAMLSLTGFGHSAGTRVAPALWNSFP
jgi:hypothetical protein